MQQPTVHLEGLGFPEGPVELADGRIAFVDLRDRCLRIFDPESGSVEVVASFTGSPNGLRVGPDGGLYVANNGGVWPSAAKDVVLAEPQVPGMIERVDPRTGEVVDALAAPDGDGPLRPNDLIFTPDGAVVFTDPRNWEVLPDFDAYEMGRLYIAELGGRPRVLAKVDRFCNGLAFHPDGSLLVGLSFANRILRYEWRDGAELSEPTVWAELDEHVAPDGMIFAGDKLIVTGSRGDEVQVLDSDGIVSERIPLGLDSDPTNVCVAHGRVWVTLGYRGQLLSWPWLG